MNSLDSTFQFKSINNVIKDLYFLIGLIGKSSLLPLCVMVPGCYACVYETQHRARVLGIREGTCSSYVYGANWLFVD